MKIEVLDDPVALGEATSTKAAQLIRETVEAKGSANIILATGTSQFETLKHLVLIKDIDWSKVVMFHLDEYIGLSETHPASFRKYLKERFIKEVPKLKKAFLIDAEGDAIEECKRLNKLILEYSIDVALIGIGENGHLAFNDPPADFETEEPYIIVELDEACRKQQLGEGWFASIDEVPAKAISMSIKQIMKSENIICSVPDNRKAFAVRNTLNQEVSNLYPSTILQRHNSCILYLDKAAAAMIV